MPKPSEQAAFGIYPQAGKRGQRKPTAREQLAQIFSDDRAMELPKLEDYDLSVPTMENRALSQRISARQADLKRQSDEAMSPLEKIAGGMQTGRLIGSGMYQAAKSLPTAITKGGKAAEEYIAENIYKPNQPKAYEYAGDIGDFLSSLETDYKIPPIIPEAMMLQNVIGPATRQAGRAAQQGARQGALNLAAPRTLNPQAGVIKLKGGNWLGGNIMGNIDENVKRLKPIKDPEKRLAAAEAQLASMKNAGGYDERTLQSQQDVIDIYKQQQAVNNWVTSNVGKYVKNQMGTPEDPLRKLFDKRTKEIEAKFAKDMERAKRFEDRALDEPDPRRQANFLREAEQLRNEAVAERSFAMEHITHVPGRMEDYSPEADYALKARRAEAGFPAEGMGESEMAKRWETLTDDAIVSMRAGDVQETKNILAQAQDAERAAKTKQLEVAQKFDKHLRDRGLSENEIKVLNEKTPIADKADMIQDREYGELSYAYNKLRSELRRDEFAAGQQNPFIDKLDPDTLLYSGNTADMGFDHVIDVIKQDVAEGRIRPEQLSKVSMEDAVRRTAEYDQEMAIKMRETALKNQEGFPLYKEYPEGYRWIELAPSKEPKVYTADNLPKGFALTKDRDGYYQVENRRTGETPITDSFSRDPEEAIAKFNQFLQAKKRDFDLEDALKYEGDTMGHCVGGYCPDVISGKSRIYSLRDAKGEPHVTVEVGKAQGRTEYGDMQKIYDQAQQEANQANFATTGEFNNFYNDRVKELQMALIDKQQAELDPRIIQIKGKQNAAPKDTYLPYVQDFVRSGQWSDVGDLGNTGLYKADPSELGMFIPSDPRLKSLPGRRTEDFEKAKQAGLFGDQKYFTRSEWEDILRKQIESESGPLPPLPDEGMARGGRVHFSDNPDVMQLELAGGGLVGKLAKAAKTAAKPVKGTQDVLPAAERDANLAKFLEPSVVKDRMYHATSRDFNEFADNPRGVHFVTPSPEWAYKFLSQDGGMPPNPSIMPLHINARNPFDYENRKHRDALATKASIGKLGMDEIKKGKWGRIEDRTTLQAIKDLGHDGVYVKENGVKNIGVFDPAQIKSAIGNRGTYDIEEPDITKAAGGAVQMSGGGALAKMGAKGAAKGAKEAAVPLSVPRVRPTTKDIMEAAERVGKQQAGEFVRSPLLKDTTNLAGRSKREFDRLKKLDYKVTPIKDLPEMKPYEAQVGEVNIALPGDQTISDMLLESVDGIPIGTTSEGGALFGRGRLSDPEETRAFWASNIGPAELFQKKVTELAQLYDTDMVTAYHLAMGQMSNNFAQHMADASIRAIDYSKLNKDKMNAFDKVVSKGYVDPTTKERVTFENWPGIASPEEALQAMKEDPKLRKWFNNRMKTEKVTKPLDLPNAKSIEYAMTEPELRDMEINLTGLSAGRMKPGAELIPDSAHQTYSHDIPGTALGRAPELSPFSISFPDVTAFVREKYRPQDFTGTIQKVFPHQVVDEAYLDDMYKYYTQLRKVRGFNEGGAVRKAAGGEITADDLILEERKL